MTYWGVSATGWVAWTAIGTLTLAAATFVAIIVGALQRRGDRLRDDRLRAADRTEFEKQLRADQIEREDEAARQVTVEMVTEAPQNQSPGWTGLNRKVTISAPADYVVKQLVVQMAGQAGTGVTTQPVGPQTENGTIKNSRRVWSYWAEAHEQLNDPAPIISFVDRHGNLYFQYKGHTERFPQITQFTDAALAIQKWIATGPKPDSPAS
jgi:hypothetical protein